MDGSFRLAFADIGKTPSANDYLSEGSQAFDRLQDAVQAAQKRKNEWEMPYIAHKFTVLDPATIGIIYSELVAAR